MRLIALFLTSLFLTLLTFVFSPKLALASNTWTLTEPMHSVHWHTSMTTLLDGRVMVVSGGGVPFVNTTELYNPETESWEVTGDVRQHRDQFNPITLNNGKVLIAGGQTEFGSGPTASSELYDPASGQWTFTDDHEVARQVAIYIKLLDGRVLAIGGLDTLTTEIFDPETEHWSLSGTLNHQRSGTERNAVVLNDGKVLVIGAGGPTNTAEIFDPATGIWTPTENTIATRVEGMLIKLQDGRALLIAGGTVGGVLSDSEIFDPETGHWTVVHPVNIARSMPNGVLLPDGRVFVSGGLNAGVTVKQSEIYDPESDSWTVDASMNFGHHAGQMAMLSNGKILIAGGFDYDLTEAPYFQTTSAELYAAEPEFSTITYDNRTKSVTFDTSHDCAELSQDSEVALWIGTTLDDYSNATRLWRRFENLPLFPSTTGILYDTYQITGQEPLAGTTYYAWMACGQNPTEAAANGNFFNTSFIFDPTPLEIVMSPTAPVNTQISAQTFFTDSNLTNTYNVAWDWGDGAGMSAGTVSAENGGFKVTGNHSYTQPGVYVVNAKVYGSDGAYFNGRFNYVTVFDSNTSLAGGRSFDNPLTANLSTPGKVTFGISSKYSGNNLTGNFKMNFKAAGLDFNSTLLQSLATKNGRAYLSGLGELNNVGGYKFLVVGIDGSVVSGDDFIRIQIKDMLNAVVYDSQLGAATFVDPTTKVATGNVRIH